MQTRLHLRPNEASTSSGTGCSMKLCVSCSSSAPAVPLHLLSRLLDARVDDARKLPVDARELPRARSALHRRRAGDRKTRVREGPTHPLQIPRAQQQRVC
eukprot:6191816-Pleurochrysis_carterae.AAC.3